jgi:peroxiredoxin
MSNAPVTTGDIAPDFEAPVLGGGLISLASLRGRKVWLAFFRYASCPLCNLRVHRMIERHPVLERHGLAVVAVFQSPLERLERHVGRQRPPFPLASDPSESLYRLYGVGASVSGLAAPRVMAGLVQAAREGFRAGRPDGTLSRIPADFLIDEEGRVVDAFHGRDIGDHIPFERVERFLGIESG